ncbi:beta-N-acetylhexosaminidase, putative [Trichomonas vaginalis G3]|uniref:Beta-N-acetylhexosaminidase, putative n=1 Tax=Trichomonas vaginalis (strain ATCC PRA-98 / G3) TaxID=412133 RepID=A2EJN8_TRIV3|nr:N-acetyl-beta-D-galactosaminidase protein [Trichomonas vaginalis G3]EAY07112.1 beta-N-acetylhexosaminidase, putative [Trichomonas vaginalis G3]KAI5522467.1 N-acetyl-beta-D-galactosaminidase protein [Trichomonas vaginalis G3]|eukprot:XP_001319335.1 beta-N-acetylhexosaminidase [Trichomonas vaginalis G3]
MTNGKRGNWNFDDGTWQGFHYSTSYEYTFDVTIDLENVTEMHEIYATFLRNDQQMIYLPEHVKISLSYDGTTFMNIMDEHYQWTDSPTTAYQAKGWKGAAYGRYIRFQAAVYSDHPHWMFVDEVVVF